MTKTYVLGGILLVMIAASVLAVGLFSPHHDLLSFERHGSARIIAAADHDASAKPSPPQLGQMKLEGQYAGPLKDTIIQRWRDPVDGTVCYLYLPVAVPHAPGPSGLVQYGANGIGSISCFAAQPVTPR